MKKQALKLEASRVSVFAAVGDATEQLLTNYSQKCECVLLIKHFLTCDAFNKSIVIHLLHFAKDLNDRKYMYVSTATQ